MMSAAKFSCDVTHLEGHASWNDTGPTEPAVLQEEPSAPEVLGTPSKLSKGLDSQWQNVVLHCTAPWPYQLKTSQASGSSVSSSS